MVFRVKEIRESKNMTQTELAEKAGIARQVVWKMENEEDVVVTSTTLLALSRALGVSPGDLFCHDCP